MLETYRKKRDFSKTPEPSWKKNKKEGNFLYMVHKHDARQLHFDLRLESEWVLKSWAVPKWLSTDPSDKKLAMMVEDHPFDYKDFEWTIPKSEYGGWTVMIWDYGTYEVVWWTWDKKKDEKIIKEKIERWLFSFIADWQKLKWEFSLVKIKKDIKSSWLLIKKNDEYANMDIENPDKSAKSGKTMEEIEKWEELMDVEKILNKDFKNVKKWKLPKNVKPMLSDLSNEPFDKKDWIFEIKWDWYRAIAEIEKWKVNLYSRNLLSFNKKFSEIVESLEKLNFNVVFDGEVVVFDKDNKVNFEYLQNYEVQKKWILVYFIFDILYLDWYILMDMPLLKRKEILKKILPDLPNIKYTDHFEEKWIEAFELIKKQGIEWLIWKNWLSRYLEWVRWKDWVKIKNILSQEAIICWYTKPRWARKWIWALILWVYDDEKLKYIWHTGWWFTDKLLQETKKLLDEYISPNCPFDVIPKTNEKPTWLKPEIVCEVKFTQWTNEGLLRQPIFLGIREDKNPEDVFREDIKKENIISKESRIQDDSSSLLESKSKAKGWKQEWQKLIFTNLEKIFFPEEKITKGDLIEYYKNISSYILPYLKDRPESLNRFPNWINEKSFYKKNFEKNELPKWINTYIYHSESEKRDINYILAQNEESLLYMINLWCIDINPWSSRIQKIDYPDYIIFDLDPNWVDFSEVVKVARSTIEILESIWIKSFCKTSGATWIHILVPTWAKYTYDQVMIFAKLVNILINSKFPKITSIERKTSNRKNMIYLDYLQNRKGQTIASIYSIRPRKMATVSTPLELNELNGKLRPENFTYKNIFWRLDKYGDIWGWFFEYEFDMEEWLRKLEKLF